MDESERERVDTACRRLTASWVRERAAAGAHVQTCDFFESFEGSGGGGGAAAGQAAGNEAASALRGIFDLGDLKELGRERGWCPYFLARQAITYADVVVFSYQYMLDPKIASAVSRELDASAVVVFDEAHNIDNVCTEALSVTLDRRLLDAASRNLATLES